MGLRLLRLALPPKQTLPLPWLGHNRLAVDDRAKPIALNNRVSHGPGILHGLQCPAQSKLSQSPAGAKRMHGQNIGPPRFSSSAHARLSCSASSPNARPMFDATSLNLSRSKSSAMTSRNPGTGDAVKSAGAKTMRPRRMVGACVCPFHVLCGFALRFALIHSFTFTAAPCHKLTHSTSLAVHAIRKNAKSQVRACPVFAIPPLRKVSQG